VLDGVCAQKRAPVAAFPAHWAPNDLALYHGDQFPERYRGGAFIAFHGSWNRAPFPQAGYNVVFQPFADGKPTGRYEVFADGFAGAVKEPGRAAHRPAGLAATPAERVGPPEGIHPDAGADAAGLPTPKGATAAMVALGDRVYHTNTCVGCHGSNAEGTPLGSDLTKGKSLWGDGSVAAIARTITQGVAKPKEHTGVMPPMGGAQLSPSEVSALAAYIAALTQRAEHGAGAARR